ncbi:MAG TPA: ABC transporter permease [Longimicrobiales bacterium]|nr:ABC transporter permease [Longimicrobiales bacterium]
MLRRLRPLLRKRATERELDEELAFHIEMEVELLMSEGMSEAEARRAALVSFGGVERTKEEVRQARWVRWLEDVGADVRYALRSIRRYPGFAAAVVVTLALGIGGTTAIFGVADGLFLRTPSGVRDAAELRKLYIRRDEGSVRTPEGGPGSYLDYEALRDGARAFSGVSAYFVRQTDLGRGAEAEQVRTAAVTANHFDLLGVRPALGRFFVAEEDGVAGAFPVAVISLALWQRRFGGERDVIDETLIVNGQPLTIVGVTERGFVGTTAEAIDVWVPAAMATPLGLMGFAGNDWRTMQGMAAIDYIARVAPGVDESTATTDGNAALAHLAEQLESSDPTPELLLTKLTAASGPRRTKTHDLSLWLVLVAGIVLIIACANVANLLLARSIARRRELAVRLSLGAGKGRIIRQNLTESLVLALAGGAAGVLVAHWASGLLHHFALPPWAGRTDMRLLGFALGVSLLTGLLFGVLPALRSGSVDPLRGMQDTRVMPSMSRSHTRRALVALQVSLSLALLVGAGLFVRSLREVLTIDTGVDVNRLVYVTIDLKKAGFTTSEAELFWQQARERVARVPGIESSAMVHFAPFIGMAYGGMWSSPGVAADFTEGPYFNLAGPGFFRTAGTRLLEGRDFAASDAGGERVAIVNRAMADGIAQDRSAIGMCLYIGDKAKSPPCTRVVGIVENARRNYLDEAAPPLLYLARNQDPEMIGWGGPALLVRTRGDGDEYVDAVRSTIAGMRGDLPFVNTRPLTEMIRRDLLPFQLGATLFSMFSVLALALAAVGLYGVLGYFVSERRPEIGIRRSLGAPARSVVTLVARQGLAPVAIGMLIGLGAALAGTRFLGSLLFGVEARDPLTFALAVTFLALVSIAAAVAPAVRAVRVEPMVALRTD